MPLIDLVDMNRRSGAGTSIRKSRGLDLASSLDAKLGVRSRNKRKTWGGLVPQEAKSGTFLGSYLKFKRQNLGYFLPVLLVAKFGADVNFRGKFWANPPTT